MRPQRLALDPGVMYAYMEEPDLDETFSPIPSVRVPVSPALRQVRRLHGASSLAIRVGVSVQASIRIADRQECLVAFICFAHQASQPRGSCRDGAACR